MGSCAGEPFTLTKKAAPPIAAPPSQVIADLRRVAVAKQRQVLSSQHRWDTAESAYFQPATRSPTYGKERSPPTWREGACVRRV